MTTWIASFYQHFVFINFSTLVDIASIYTFWKYKAK